jgi:hypothetical protein
VRHCLSACQREGLPAGRACQHSAGPLILKLPTYSSDETMRLV